MKIKKNELFLLIAVVGILVAVASYLWVYTPNKEKTEALESENKSQAAYLAQLEEWKAQEQTYLDETAKMVGEVNELFKNFPAGSRAEDVIMYAVELETTDENTFISSINLSDPAVAYSASPTSVKLNDFDEAKERTYRLYAQTIDMSHEFTYDGMKTYVNTIVNNPNRKSISTLNMNFDSGTGLLVGSTSMSLYTLTGTDKVYQETDIPTMPMGTENIFGTIN